MAADLSVVMIGRDEELDLPRALRSVRGIARQVVFVDTGSVDRTRSVAREEGAEVHAFSWIDDFSAARNAGLERATGRCVLVLDCDEELAEPGTSAARIEAACASEEGVAWAVELVNLAPDGSSTRHQALRMFRNDPRIRFRNPVHESVAESVFQHWPDHAVPAAPFRLLHHGYAKGKNAEKFHRNLAILRSWLEREPLHIYASYKYGASLFQLGEVEGLEWLGRAFELLDRRADKATFPFGRALAASYLACLERYHQQDEAASVRARLARW